MLDVVGIGTNSVDDVLVIEGFLPDVVSSGKGRVQGRHLFTGGQTATAMCACSVFGLRCGYVGVFGSDEKGRSVRRALEDHGVATNHSVVVDGPNRSAIIIVDASGRRTVLWHRSVQLSLAHLPLEAGALSARIVHVDDDGAAGALMAIRVARASQVAVTSDIEHLNNSTDELISSVTYPIFGEHLPAALTGESDQERALRKLRRLNSGVLCVTLGDRGAAALEGDRFYLSPGFNVEVADDTGAGDVFRAGFIYGVLNGWRIPEVLRFANAAAALSCTRLGAIPSVPSLEAVQSLLAGTNH